MSACWWAAVVIALALASGQIMRWRDLPTAPAKRDPATAQAWMADSLPNIGTKRIAPTLDALHHGRFDELPKAARDEARQVFTDPGTP